MKLLHCMSCHISTSELDRLKRLKDVLYHIEPTNNYSIRFNWYFNPRCKFGVSCNEITKLKRQLERYAEEIEPKLVTLGLSDDDNLYHQVLRLLQGYFPSVYKQLEIIYHTKQK